MKQYGCIGMKLTHSFSKEIHARLADYSYELIELSEEEIRPFFEKRRLRRSMSRFPISRRSFPSLTK